MTDSTITAWTGQIADYTVQGPTGLTFGTFSQWEDAQVFALGFIMGSTLVDELFIMREGEAIELISEDQQPVQLKIIIGECGWCEERGMEVVKLDEGDICQECSGIHAYGENVWTYLRG